jgi:hypothetical protein
MRGTSNRAIFAGVFLAAVIWTALTPGQLPDDPIFKEPSARCETFLAGLRNNVDDAYAALLKDGPLPRDKDRLSKVVADTKKLFTMEAHYGKPRAENAVERVKAQRIGNDMVLLRYLYKFDQLPVVWYFAFYRTGEKWVAVSVRFDHEYELLGL